MNFYKLKDTIVLGFFTGIIVFFWTFTGTFFSKKFTAYIFTGWTILEIAGCIIDGTVRSLKQNLARIMMEMRWIRREIVWGQIERVKFEWISPPVTRVVQDLVVFSLPSGTRRFLYGRPRPLAT